MKRVFSAIWPGHRGLISAAFVIALLIAFLPFASTGAQALVINELVATGQHGVTTKIVLYLVLLISMLFLRDVIGAVQMLVQKRLWSRLTEFFELIMLKKRSEIDVATYENPKFHDLLSKTTEKGIFPICNLIERQIQQVTNIAQMAVAATVFFVFDWRFFVLALLSALPDFVVQMKSGKASWDIWDEDSQTRRRLTDLRRHFLGLNRLTELKIFQNVTKFYGLVAEMYSAFREKQWALDRRAYRWRMYASVVSIAFQAAPYVWVIWLVSHGEMQIGTMAFLLGSFGSFEGGLIGFFSGIAYQFEWSLYAKDMFTVIDTEPLLTDREGAVMASPDVAPRIEFRDVSFAYPNTDRLILKNVNLTIESGERLAIVGLNGAGKSTLIKLLMRFYDPTGGEILVNGVDLKQIERESWWSLVAALFQDYADYKFPVKEVIALGRSNGNGHLRKVVRAAKEAEAHPFIEAFASQYNQMIGKEFDGGVDLSVGQSQKLALARSMYRAPRLMILDEPTASIDAESEDRIFASLEAGSGERTQIVISHRFSTVRRSDKICVLQDGAVSELGTHAELMDNNQTYARLFRLQAKGYE
jgi:ATP-binding cassette subfamily B protein